MELVMGGLLMGVGGMLLLLIIAAWKDSAPRPAETPSALQRRMNQRASTHLSIAP
jgi:hypothetical protein